VAFAIEALTRGHERESFDCGEPALNDYLRQYARQNQERGIGRTFVAVPEGKRRVVGFYTLSAGSVEFADMPYELRRRLPRYPVPVAHLGRLATCLSVRGQGLGETLLFDALLRTLRVAEEVGIVALEVRAKTEQVRAYYQRYGFHSMLDDRLHLYLPLATARQLVDE
jgi:ribosomal protein S18 acetylase RimI-like enzyme